MRNLKRVLALGMALVLTLGLMVTASAATAGTDYTDDKAIGATNDEAVQVLTALGVFEGDGKAFNPANKITRMEVAALAYRIMTTDVKNEKIDLYQTWAKFDDVKSTDWYAGYVNYVANAGILDGDGQGNFYPNANITGYQLLKIVLCALGYGQNGEYVGADWDKRTSSKANELGLLDGVSEDLGQPITRATVAQILFNGMTKALVVDYFLGYYWPMNIYTGAVITDNKTTIQGGGAPNADSKDNFVATLGYKQFGLFADHVAAQGATDTTLVKLGVRNAATPDTKYGEPIAYWYYDVNKDGVADVDENNNKITIDVRFNPIATFTTAVTEKALYAAAKLKTTATKVDYIDYLAVDGDDKIDVTVGEKVNTVVEGTGKGVETEVFKADGKDFVVIKNTYVNVVYKALTVDTTTGGVKTDLKLGNETTNVDAGATKDDVAALKDIKANTVVIYNKYTVSAKADTIDASSIHAAPEYKVTVTNTYDVTKDGTATDTKNESYFLASSKKYEYNALYGEAADSDAQKVLNRDTTGFKKDKFVYTDDNGYVVLTADQKGVSYDYGYVVLTKAAYNNYELDNVHYVKFTGYDSTGKAKTLNGGIGTFVYADAGVAGAVANNNSQLLPTETVGFEKGIYYFQYDAELGLYMLEKTQDIMDNATTTKFDEDNLPMIYNGQADPVVDINSAIVDNETVYVIVNYNSLGGITGYTVKTGFKTIGDLYDDQRDTLAVADGGWNKNLKNVAWSVDYVNVDAKKEAEGSTPTIDLVYIEGATSEADNNGFEVKDEGFILLDEIPEDKVTEYDQHAVVENGKATTKKFWPDFVAKYNSNAGMVEGTYYEVDQLRNGYVYSLSSDVVTPVELKYVAPGVLDAGTGANVWADEHDLTGSQYLTLNDKCVVYEVDTATGTCKTVDVAKVDTTKTDKDTGADIGGTAIIAARDDYGFATVIYIVK